MVSCRTMCKAEKGVRKKDKRNQRQAELVRGRLAHRNTMNHTIHPLKCFFIIPEIYMGLRYRYPTEEFGIPCPQHLMSPQLYREQENEPMWVQYIIAMNLDPNFKTNTNLYVNKCIHGCQQ